MAGENWVHQQRSSTKQFITNNNVLIRDVNPDFTVDNKNIVLENDEAIKGQMRHLLSTPLGSDDFEPYYGSNLPYRLFDPICDLTAYLMETDTIVAITTWMRDKLVLINPTITPYPDDNLYLVSLPYRKLIESGSSVTSYYFEISTK